MSASEAWLRSGAEERVLSGADLVRIGREGQAFRIAAGTLALACADREKGTPARRLRVLAHLEPGRTVFFAPIAEEQGAELVLAPLERATVQVVSLERLWRGVRAGDEIYASLDEWIRQLASLVRTAEPRGAISADGSEEVQLEPGQALRPHRGVLWARVEEGVVRHPGSSAPALEPGSGLAPLAAGLWLDAPARARLTLHRTAEIAAWAELEPGLARLQALVLERLAAERAREEGELLVRLRQRGRSEGAQLDQAVAGLASLLRAQAEPPPSEDELSCALAAVGRRSGLTIRAGGARLTDARADPLEEITRVSRIRLRRVVLEDRWWKRDVGDLLAFSRAERRPLALLRTRRLNYEIFDPRDGRRTPVDARSAAELAPEALMPYRSLPDRPLGLVDLLRFSLEHRTRDLLYALASGLSASALGLLVPQATALLMDHAIPDADRRASLELGAGLLAAALGQTSFLLARGFALVRFGTLSESESQAALWDRLLCLRPAFFRRFSSGDLQARVNAVGDIGQALGSATLSLVFSGSVVLLNLALLSSYDARLAAVAVGIGALVAACTLVAGARIRASMRQLLDLQGRFYGQVVQLVRGVAKLRVAGAGERAFAHWLRRLTQVLELVQEGSRRSQWLVIFNQAVPVLSTTLLFLLAHERIQAARAGELDGMSLGMFLAFASAFGVFLAGVGDLSNTVAGLLDVSVTSERVAPILVEVPESAGNKREPGSLLGGIAMERVGFSYGGSGPRVLDDLSLTVEPGQFAAVVGPSGSGKSTLLRLLLGFELPDSGVVRYDGHDLSELDATAVRSQLGVVLQGGRLDAGSIFENISGGAPISLDEAWSAAEDAGIADEIRAMPMGMHTLISSGGGNLSGGQRQRLLVARALVRRPRVLFLDEATSALDNRTQAVIARSLERLRATRLVVAHRLSTIRGADRIFVVEGGRIAQRGTFDELAAQKEGLFARLIRRQSE